MNKYFLYEQAVQSPQVHARWFQKIFYEMLGRKPRHLREDFCGTFQLSTEWVKLDSTHTALSLDLDPRPLEDGKKRHASLLDSHQRKQLKILKKNVLSVTRPSCDLIIACNFSFCIFKERRQLLTYFKNCHHSLGRQGAMIMEIAGGPGMIYPMEEKRKVILDPKMKFGGLKHFTYVWEQKCFNPITCEAQYAIHFDLPSGKRIKNAFTYDWRLWGIPELRDLLVDAGFDQTVVYWETAHAGKPTGEFVRTEKGDNAFAWIAYVIGLKKT